MINDIWKLIARCYYLPLVYVFLFVLVFSTILLGFEEEPKKKTVPKKSLLQFWLHFVMRKPVHFFTVVALNSFVACKPIFISFAFGVIVQNVSAITNKKALTTEPLLDITFYLLIPLIALCMDIISKIIMARLMPWLAKVIREHYFDYICDYAYGYMSDNTISVNRIIDIVGGSVNFFENVMKNIIPTAVHVCVAMGWFFWVNFKFFILYVLWCVFHISFSMLRVWRNKYNQSNTRYYMNLMSEISDIFNKISVAKVNKSESFEKDYFRAFNYLDVGSYRQLRKYNAVTIFVSGFAYCLFFYFIFARKTLLEVISGNIGIDKFIEINATARALSFDIWNTSDLFGPTFYEAQRVVVAMRDLHIKNEVEDKGGECLEVGKSGVIFFDGVSFGYDERGPILKNLTLELELGKKYAIVGHSGCGKSSLVNLLLRFGDPQKGSVKINGTDIRRFTLASLRQAIGLVPQSDSFFKRPIFMNIAYGCEEIREETSVVLNEKGPNVSFSDLSEKSQARILSAAQVVGLDKIITKNAKGYNAMFGVDIALSGGQRQRLSIARVIIGQKNAILILDESTSALDGESELEILDIIKKLKMTVIKISHRLDTVKDDYNIIMVKNGQVAERGAHRDLMALHGAYYQLYSTAARG